MYIVRALVIWDFLLSPFFSNVLLCHIELQLHTKLTENIQCYCSTVIYIERFITQNIGHIPLLLSIFVLLFIS